MSLGATSTAAEVIGSVRLDGRHAVVTCGSGGIGLETARVLASAGARVTIAVRDHDKGDAALRAIRSELPDADVVQEALDLTSLVSARSFCERLRGSTGHLATDLARHMDADDFNRLIERAQARTEEAQVAGNSDAPPVGMPSFKTVPQGAATSIWACIASELDAHGGAYCSDCAIATPEPWARDVGAAQQLWELSERLTATAFPS